MKVRANTKYKYQPNGWDIYDKAPLNDLQPGDIVKVVNKYGCPKANTMGQCYVEKDGVFRGMVSTGSLTKN